MTAKQWLGFLILVLGLVGVWTLFAHSGARLEALGERIQVVRDEGDPDNVLDSLTSLRTSLEGQRVFNGILLALLCAGVVGILFVVHVFPVIAHRLTHVAYGSGEEPEPDGMQAARSLLARGKYEEAIGEFRRVAGEQPLNRVPWLEIAKIQKNHLHQPQVAIGAIREAMAGQEWGEDDTAFFLFRLAEMYDHDASDRASAVMTLKQVIRQFPETKHSTNARHKLDDWGMD